MNKWKRYELFFTASIKDKISEEEIERIVKPLYEEEGFSSVYETTKNKKMLPFVASMLVSADVDWGNWELVLKKYRKRNEIVRQQLSVVYETMEKAGVKKLFISENYGALLNSGRDIALFASGDIDNCGDLSEKHQIDLVFESLGYTKKDRFSGKALSSTSYHNNDLLSDNFSFGVCWEPLSRLKLPCFINMDDFVNWDSLRQLKGTSIKMPSVEALLYICLMHITLHSFHRAPAIRLYVDIMNSCYNKNVDWEKIYAWAKRDHTVTRMMTSAILANKVAEVTIPDFVKTFENDKRVKRLLSFAYDAEAGCLNPEPGRMGVFSIEISCNDKNQVCGLKEMLYPGKKWLKEHYGHGVFVSSLLHLKNMI